MLEFVVPPEGQMHFRAKNRLLTPRRVLAFA